MTYLRVGICVVVLISEVMSQKVSNIEERKEGLAPFTNSTQHKDSLNISYRWSIYKGLEALGEELGLVGRSCVLRSICEAAETPFDHRSGLMAEVLHILLTPSSSFDDLSTHTDNEYFQAERLGKSKAICSNIFRECKQSLLQHFTGVHDF